MVSIWKVNHQFLLSDLLCPVMWPRAPKKKVKLRPNGLAPKGRNAPAQPLDIWSVWGGSYEVGNISARCVQLRRKLSEPCGAVCSDWTYEVWGGGLLDVWAIEFSDWLCASCMTILIGGVLANQRGVLGGGILCALSFAMQNPPVIICFHVLEYWHETSCYYVCSGQINLCSFGNASLHV